MNGKEFAKHLEAWRQELNEEVLPHFASRNQERGRLAFSRWKERFIEFLKSNAPSEASRFQQVTYHIAWVVKPGEHSLDQFMREDGNTCVAFIDDLMESALKNRLSDLRTLPTQLERTSARRLVPTSVRKPRSKPTVVFKTSFDTYESVEIVGEGGSGRVYKAVDSGGVVVAVKV